MCLRVPCRRFVGQPTMEGVEQKRNVYSCKNHGYNIAFTIYIRDYPLFLKRCAIKKCVGAMRIFAPLRNSIFISQCVCCWRKLYHSWNGAVVSGLQICLWILSSKRSKYKSLHHRLNYFINYFFLVVKTLNYFKHFKLLFLVEKLPL